MLTSRLFLVIPAAALAACSDGTGAACLQSIQPALVVDIRDSATQLGIAAQAIAQASDGGFTDTLRFVDAPDSVSRQGPDERPGNYTLVISHPDYLTWTRDNLLVTKGPCHVNTIHLIALLQHI